jgi:DNA-binding transcriptional LysR family regulator
MAAAAYTVSLAVDTSAGRRLLRLTASDVAAAFWLYPSGASELPLDPKGSAVIRDIIYSAAGTDTTQVAVYKNGVDTGIRLSNAANLGTVINRQVQGSPIAFAPGDIVKFTQLA